MISVATRHPKRDHVLDHKAQEHSQTMLDLVIQLIQKPRAYLESAANRSHHIDENQDLLLL